MSVRDSRSSRLHAGQRRGGRAAFMMGRRRRHQQEIVVVPLAGCTRKEARLGSSVVINRAPARNNPPQQADRPRTSATRVRGTDVTEYFARLAGSFRLDV